MSSDIYAKSDLSVKVRFSRKEQEDIADWEQREVDIYESTDDVGDSYIHFQSRGGGPQAQNPPSVQKGAFRCATLGLGVLYLLMLAGIIILSIYFALNKRKNSKLQAKYNTLNNSYSQLQDELRETRNNISHLQSSYDRLSENHSQLWKKMKKQKKMEEKCPDRWTRFRGSCYFKINEIKTWSESRRDCLKRGADLVIINSKEEQEFISELNLRGESWIGLEANYQQSGWKYKWEWEWVDGSALTEMFWAPGFGNPSSDSRGVCCDDHGRWTHSPEYSHVDKTWICEK
ncbi:CD209 antigen-like protein C [Archocentrus centrarchus]|uniref:CD209 antigen-like protein C n=1 Tax=Archocentrus centrarchus TaxID=63155 RepID=UPI0011E9B5EA|nr:CD209 antigen-like protein C [Archocentrus centrarchus]